MIYDFDEIIDRKSDLSAKYNEVEAKYGRDDIIPLWIADMDFAVAEPIVQAMGERLSKGAFGYTTRPSFYNQSIMNWFKERHDWEIEEDWLMFSPGVIPSISLIIQNFTQEGDKIIIQEPVYSPFFSVVKDNNREVIINSLKKESCGKYVMDFDDLESKIDDKTKMMILCSPHNPVGRVWTKEELERLGQICLKHNIRIISDEIHCDLTYKGVKHIPIASLSEELKKATITCIAPSKTFNIPGLQASAIVLPNKEDYKVMEDAFTKIDIKRNNCFSLVATHAAYSKCGGWLHQLNQYIEKNADFVVDYINKNIPKLKVNKPEGTFLLWIDFSELGMDDKTLRDFVINEAKLALNDGATFGSSGKGYQRMNIACPKSVLEEALNRLKVAIDKL